MVLIFPTSLLDCPHPEAGSEAVAAARQPQGGRAAVAVQEVEPVAVLLG
jgi:hypothetical protein